MEFELYSFYSNYDVTVEGLSAGIDGVIIDLESKGKQGRQDLYNTQINKHTISDLQKIRSATSKRVICRVNGGKFLSEDEISEVIAAGADEVLIPMVTSAHEVEQAQNLTQGKTDLSIMIETNEAVFLVEAFNAYPLKRAFIGLNDLSIARNEGNLFVPLIDGTVQHIRDRTKLPLGVAGLTHPDKGSPIPCRALINEMKRLECSFGFLRRSFFSDILQYSQKEIVNALKQEFSVPDFDPESNQVLAGLVSEALVSIRKDSDISFPQ